MASLELSVGFARQRRVIALTKAERSDDTLLVEAAREGNRAAFGQLYDRYARLVHGILLARVSPREADDLVQEVFLRALNRLHTLRQPAVFGEWLATIDRRDFGVLGLGWSGGQFILGHEVNVHLILSAESAR